MKKYLLCIAAILLIVLTGCRKAVFAPEQASEISVPDQPVQENVSEPVGSIAEQEDPIEEQEEQSMKITIGNYEFTVMMENNDTAEALEAQLPLQLDMSELHGNEKYNYLPFRLPTDAHAPGQIQTGDVMLYGENCLVVFYQSFPSSYSYTKIGHIADAAGLQEAVGTGNVQMTFTK